MAGVSKSGVSMAAIYNFPLESWVVRNEVKDRYLDNIVGDRALCQRYVYVSGAVVEQYFSN